MRRPSYFLKGHRLDLSDPLAGDATLDGKFVEGKRRIHKPAPLENATFAVIENRERLAKRPSAGFRLLGFGETRFLAGTFLHQRVLPFGRIALLVHRHIEGNVTADALVHLNDVPFGDAKFIGNDRYLLRVQIALLKRGYSALRLGQIEKELLLIDGGSYLHERPRAHDVI